MSPNSSKRVWISSLFDTPVVSVIRSDATGPSVYSPANGWQPLPADGRPRVDQVFPCSRFAGGSCFGRQWYVDIPVAAIDPGVTAIGEHWLSGNTVNDSLRVYPIGLGVSEIRIGYAKD